MVNNRVTAVLRQLHADGGSYMAWLPPDMMLGLLARYFDMFVWADEMTSRVIYHHKSTLPLWSKAVNVLVLRSGDLIMYCSDQPATSVRLYVDSEGRYYSSAFHDFYRLIVAYLGDKYDGTFYYELFEHADGYWIYVGGEDDDVILRCYAEMTMRVVWRTTRSILQIICDDKWLYVLHADAIDRSSAVLDTLLDDIETSVSIAFNFHPIADAQKIGETLCFITSLGGVEYQLVYLDLKTGVVDGRPPQLLSHDVDGCVCSCDGVVYYYSKWVMYRSTSLNIYLRGRCSPGISVGLSVVGTSKVILLADGRFLVVTANKYEQQLQLIE